MNRKLISLLLIICLAYFPACNEDSQSKEETTTETTTEDVDKAMQDVIDAYEDAYNNENAAGIKDLFTADAVRTEVDGSVTNGNEAIGKLYEDAFATSDTKLTITQETTEQQADGSIYSTGTRQVTGKTSAGEDINRQGTYEVTDVKENGNWKIKKQVVTEQ